MWARSRGVRPGLGQCRRARGVGSFVSERSPQRGSRRHGAVATVQTPAQRSLHGLIRAGGLLRALSEPHFARYGVSPAQWGVLRSLLRLEREGRDRPRMHELGAVMLVRPPSLSATLDRMERSALVARGEDPADRRTRLVALAPQGRRLLERVMAGHRRWIARVMGGLNVREQVALEVLLAKLGGHMHGLRDREQRPDDDKGKLPRRALRGRAS
jgi:DNA-binding MarR family transcriptional regulator